MMTYLREKMFRTLWNGVYIALFRFSPRIFHGWRSTLLRAFGAKIGKGCHIYPKVIIHAPWNLSCEDNVGIADKAVIYNQAPVRVGERSVISQGAHICTGTHDYNDEKFRLVAKPINIGRNSWVCAEVFVMPGVNIGDGAVVGARSVVTKDVLPWTVCAGNPCRIIKERTKPLSSGKSATK
jgi:putative colanic acid biosynthesis acetyltransferase WcaF